MGGAVESEKGFEGCELVDFCGANDAWQISCFRYCFALALYVLVRWWASDGDGTDRLGVCFVFLYTFLGMTDGKRMIPKYNAFFPMVIYLSALGSRIM